MQVCGQDFTPALITRIESTLVEEPSLSRRALSRRVCQWLEWRGANGRLKEMSARVALKRLERRGELRLPAPQAGVRAAVDAGAAGEGEPIRGEARGISQSLRALGPVELVLIGDARSAEGQVWRALVRYLIHSPTAGYLGAVAFSRRGGCVRAIARLRDARYRWRIWPPTCWASAEGQVWRALMQRHHRLGAGPLCGAQLRYLIHSPTAGYLGAVAFSSAAWRVRARDSAIGWTEPQRREHLDEVVCNSRFLIVPQVQVAHLASHVLGQLTRTLRADWAARYGIEPVLVESYVEHPRYRGTCYRAANWQGVGYTTGRGRQDRTRTATDRSRLSTCILWYATGVNACAPRPRWRPSAARKAIGRWRSSPESTWAMRAWMRACSPWRATSMHALKRSCQAPVRAWPKQRRLIGCSTTGE